MLTGSVVSSLHGEPRLTHDVDIIVAIHSADISRLTEAFPPPAFYVDEEEARDAIAADSMFILIDIESSEKADFWVLTEEPFDGSRFGRRITVDLFGRQVNVSSPEDTILAKLRWLKQSGGSEKQFLDALRVYEVQGDGLDMGYLGEWADTLGIADLLDKVVADSVL